MIANLVKLNNKSKYTCSECKHGSITRFKKHKLTPTERRHTYSQFNFAIPPPGPLAQLELTDPEEYIISRCIVAMHIENRRNDSNRPTQSKRTGHGCILPLDLAHTYADYVNQHSLPRERNSLLFYDVVQEGTGDEEYLFRVNADRMQQTLTWRKHYNTEYHDVPIRDDIFNDYRRNPDVKTTLIHLTEADTHDDDDLVDITAQDAVFDDIQEHKENEIVRVSHNGASEGVEHVNTASEQALLNEGEQRRPVYGYVATPNTGRLSKKALKKVLDLQNSMKCQAQESALNADTPTPPTPPPLRIKKRPIKPINEFEREVAYLVRAFPKLFVFGDCGWNNTRRIHTFEDFRAWVAHLLKLCYAREDKDGKRTLHYPFQANSTFVHYCHNRIHRQRVSSSMRFYLKHSAPKELLDPDFKVADLEQMNSKDVARMVHHAVVRIRPLEGDPGHLRQVANNMRSFTMDYECPSEFTTTAYNDLHDDALHTKKILPYLDDQDADDVRLRADMVYSNPATVSFFFLMKILIRRDVLARFSYPTNFIKWFVDKFEFQNRGSVHDHALQKLIFLFLKIAAEDKTTFTKDDFQQIDVHGPKLGYYSEMRTIAHMLVPRIERRARTLISQHPEHKEALNKLISTIHKHDMWTVVSDESKQSEATNSTQHSTQLPSDDVDHTALPSSTSLEHILALTKDSKLTEMLDSLHRSHQLGEYADKALIAVHKARIHPYDNSMERYREEFIEKSCDGKNRWLDKKNTENIARRFRSAMDKRLKTPLQDRMTAQHFYTLWHSNHQECSQFHRCRLGYCQRVRKVKGDDDSPDMTHIVCRHRWP